MRQRNRKGEMPHGQQSCQSPVLTKPVLSDVWQAPANDEA